MNALLYALYKTSLGRAPPPTPQTNYSMSFTHKVFHDLNLGFFLVTKLHHVNFDMSWINNLQTTNSKGQSYGFTSCSMARPPTANSGSTLS